MTFARSDGIDHVNRIRDRCEISEGRIDDGFVLYLEGVHYIVWDSRVVQEHRSMLPMLALVKAVLLERLGVRSVGLRLDLLLKTSCLVTNLNI